MNNGFNINEEVWVKLTPAGQKILQDKEQATDRLIRSGGYNGPSYHIERGKTWLRFQLHELMNIFGPHLYNGCETLFAGNGVYFTNPENEASEL